MATAEVTGARVRDARRTALGALAAGAAVLCAAMVVGGLLAGPGNPSPYLVVDAVQGLIYPAVGALVAARRPGNAVGWLLLGIGAAHAGDVLAGALAQQGVAGAQWWESWLWFPGLAVLTAVLPVLVPDGRPPGRAGRWLLRAAVAVVVCATALIAVLPQMDGPHEGQLVPNPLGVPGADAAVGPVFAVWSAVSLVAIGSLGVRWYRADPDGRRALLPVLAAVLVIGVALLTVTVVQSVHGGTADEPLVQAIVLPLVPLSVAVSVLRYRLFDIELVLRRSAVYAVLAVLLGLGYAAVVVGTSRLLADRFPTVPVTVATVAVALGFAPLRALVQRGVSRVLFGERDDPYAVLSGLGHRLSAAPPPGRALDGVTALICTTLRVPAATLVGRDGAVVATTGIPSAGALRLPVVVDGEPEGELVVSPRAPGNPFGTRDRELLADLARSAGPALRSDRLAAELRRSRERLVTAREEERRRLRRDLHDGLGPALATVPLQLDVAEAQLSRDPDAARAMLAEVRRTTSEVVAGMRRVVSDLRPPELEDLGLPAALADLADRVSAAGLRVELGCAGLPELSAAVELAVYRIVQEAVTNSVRHAGASTVRVTVGAHGGELAVCVADDGRGLPGDAVPGVGSTSMRERAVELGGDLERGPAADGGTVVRARVPLVPR